MVPSSDSCSTRTVYDHVMDFSLTTTSRQFFGCTRCHPYHMLLHEYSLPRFVLSVLKHVQISWDEFFTMRCAPRCCTMSYALVQAPQEIWWLMSFDDWAVLVFWGQWHRLRLLLGDQVLLVCFVDSCAVFWTTYWLICSIWLHEKFISPMDVSRHKVYLWWL